MLLDDLVTAIQTVQQRIREHGTSLSQNEYRTRLALIDPILNTLGWDVSDPKLVMPEYQVGSGRADYALLGEDGKPQAFIEAKRLGEMAEASRHETQLFTYAVTQGVRYAALTDGNRWIFDNLTARFSDGESRLLDLNISSESVHQCTFKFLLLWRPTLASERPTKPTEPIFVTHLKTEPQFEVPDEPIAVPTPSHPTSPPSSEWISLASYDPKLGIPTKIRLPNHSEIQLRNWPGLLVEIAEWLIREGLLTEDDCPVPAGGRNQHRNSLINTEARHENGGRMGKSYKLWNDFYLNRGGSSITYLGSATFLLRRFHQDPAAILLKPSQ